MAMETMLGSWSKNVGGEKYMGSDMAVKQLLAMEKPNDFASLEEAATAMAKANNRRMDGFTIKVYLSKESESGFRRSAANGRFRTSPVQKKSEPEKVKGSDRVEVCFEDPIPIVIKEPLQVEEVPKCGVSVPGTGPNKNEELIDVQVVVASSSNISMGHSVSIEPMYDLLSGLYSIKTKLISHFDGNNLLVSRSYLSKIRNWGRQVEELSRKGAQ
ncbi:hypothetical protein V6N12_058253 [Hibiscus sabdariffa]|uniref:Uncharacterized protein n=1 Tax=Hibiscus sabdariffa TaxID=183260 RepID=A0ABR2ERQ4_9ROSI